MSEADEAAQQAGRAGGGVAAALRRLLSFWLLTIGPLAAWSLATVVRITVRDRLPYAATLFYATPLPLLAGLGFLTALRLKRKQGSPIARWIALASLLQILFWGSAAFRGQQPAPLDDSLRVVFWNVSRGLFDYDEVARQIVAFDADLVTMTEAVDQGQSPEFWESACPGYTALPLSSGMLLLVRGEATLIEHDRAGPVCRWRIADVTVRGERLKVGVVDFTSNPLLFRRPGFEELAALFERHADTPLLLAGDFNTPSDTAVAAPLRERATNAWEQSGEGFRETWPVYLPLMKLDQLWASEQITWHRCRHLWSLRSDHRPVVAEFVIQQQANAAR